MLRNNRQLGMKRSSGLTFEFYDEDKMLVAGNGCVTSISRLDGHVGLIFSGHCFMFCVGHLEYKSSEYSVLWCYYLDTRRYVICWDVFKGVWFRFENWQYKVVFQPIYNSLNVSCKQNFMLLLCNAHIGFSLLVLSHCPP